MVRFGQEKHFLTIKIWREFSIKIPKFTINKNSQASKTAYFRHSQQYKISTISALFSYQHFFKSVLSAKNNEKCNGFVKTTKHYYTTTYKVIHTAKCSKNNVFINVLS